MRTSWVEPAELAGTMNAGRTLPPGLRVLAEFPEHEPARKTLARAKPGT